MKDFGGRCTHFNGIGNDTCKAGVNYLELAGGEQFGMARRIPCLLSNGVDPAICPSCHYPTPEEVAVMEAELTTHMERKRQDMALIGAAHTDAAHSLVYVCQLCDRATRTVTTTAADMIAHALDAHGLDEATVKTARGEMASHIDATEWFQNDDVFTLLDGREFLIRSSRTRRRGMDKAMWRDETQKGKRRRYR